MKRIDPNALLRAITAFHVERGYPPTVRDLCVLCGSPTTSVVQYHLDKLERDGRIRRTPGVARSIVVVG